MTKEIALQEKSVSLNSPKELADFATVLKTFIVEQKLFTPIQKKNYVNVEGWQFAGSAMGLLPVVKNVTPVEGAPEEIKYRAEVELLNIHTQSVVGYGVAICSNKESKRRSADEYVIMSMAQTRAVGKAYRNSFAWLMKMAGYETTPTEEVGELNSDLVSRINEAKTQEELQDILEGLSVEEKKIATPHMTKRSKELHNAAGN